MHFFMDALGVGNECSASGGGGSDVDHVRGEGGGDADCVYGRDDPNVDHLCVRGGGGGGGGGGSDCANGRGGSEVEH